MFHTGTPDRDAVCERCPSGYFSSTSSSTEPCVPHRDCSQLGLKTFRSGTATQDTLCETDSEEFDCSHQHIECNTGKLQQASPLKTLLSGQKGLD